MLVLSMVILCAVIQTTSIPVQEQECGTNRILECEDDIVDRVGCCPKSVLTECVKLDDPKCQGASTCTPDRLNATRFECKFRPNQNVYQNVTIWDKRSRNHLRYRLGKKCNHNLYEKRMRRIWQTYLKCPKNKLYEELLQELVEDWNYNHELLNDLCFSNLIEQCGVNNQCECFSELFYSATSTRNRALFLNFTQVQEGKDHCGLVSGSPCTHNTRGDTLVQIVGDTDCKDLNFIKQSGDLVPSPFECEVDATCVVDFFKKQCIQEPCLCTCVTEHECIGGENGGLVIGPLGTTFNSFTSLAIILLVVKVHRNWTFS